MAISETRENYLLKLAENFRRLILSERLYLRPHLSLDEVAALLHASRYDLSYSINHHLGKDFTGFINELRMEEAVRLMRLPGVPRMRINEITLLAGFADRTTFTRVCKKIKGMAPSELIEQLNT